MITRIIWTVFTFRPAPEAVSEFFWSHRRLLAPPKAVTGIVRWDVLAYLCEPVGSECKELYSEGKSIMSASSKALLLYIQG